MLTNIQTQEKQIMMSSNLVAETHEQIKQILSAQPQLQNCIKSSLALYETHFFQETPVAIANMTWLELSADLVELEAHLSASLKQAQTLLPDLSAQQNQFALSNWAKQAKQQDLQVLFRDYSVNEEFSDIIDEAFTEDDKTLLGFARPDLAVELLALLGEQCKDFSSLIQGFVLADDAEAQEAMLSKLLGDTIESDELSFDVFASGFMAMADFELSLASIATYAVLNA